MTVDEQLSILLRGAAHVEKADELRKKLVRGRPLRVKYGIDPTGFDVHLGHTVPLRKLRRPRALRPQARRLRRWAQRRRRSAGLLPALPPRCRQFARRRSCSLAGSGR